QDTIKISSNAEKVTTPGRKKVYRIVNRQNHKSEGDYITLWDENPEDEPRLKMFHPVHTYISKFVTDFDAINLHEVIFENGEQVYRLPALREIQAYAKESLSYLWDEYKRSLNPEEYPVDLSQKCWDNKMRNIEDVKGKVAKIKRESKLYEGFTEWTMYNAKSLKH